jgi:hypothetical protein
MEHYYSDEELKNMMKMSQKATLRWLEEARRFFSKVTPKKTKRLQEKMIAEGW